MSAVQKMMQPSAFDEIWSSLPYGVLALDENDIIRSINPAALELFGYDQEELLANNVELIIRRDSRTESGNYIADPNADPAQTPRIFRDAVGSRKDGSRFSAELTISPLGRRVSGECVVIIRDIDAEIESEERYRMLFETSDYPQLIIIDNKFEFANEAAVHAFGCDSVEDLKSIHPSKISPEFQPDGRDSFSKAEEMISIAYKEGGHRFDWMHCKKNGVEMLMDVILTRMPHMGADALFCGYRDITERQRTEAMVRRTQKLDAVGQLTGGIAHDFNNLLGIIRGNLEILQRALPDNEFAQKRLHSALIGTTRGADITRKLLAFSHEKVRDTKRINVNRPIRDFKNLIGRSLTTTVDIEIDLAKGIWPVDVDPGDFENVILNLALNARDAMPDGGALTIETANTTLDDDDVRENADAASGEYVMIAVSDTGTGMDAETREKVFEPFFTTKEEGKGTGLGLSMVYGFIKKSAGHIKIESEPGEGATFKVYLPRADLLPEDELVSDDEADEVLPRGSETVLIVDDEEALLEVTVAQLKSLGYSVLAANSAERALELLSQHAEIDILFSDVVMPGGMDGFTLAEKAMQSNPDLKVQMTSGFTRQFESDAESGSSLLVLLSKSLLRKPYSLRELSHSLRDCLERMES
jgi:PAS domain S-box-containing protein